MATIKRIDHVALVVADIEESLGFWRDALGLELDHIKEVPREKSAIAFLPVGGSEVELVQPTTDDSGIAKYLEKRGAGMHHICLETDDIEAMAKALSRKHKLTTIVTLGSDGALATSGDEIIRVPAMAVTAVDTTGAGDAFIGTLAAGLTEGLDLEAAMKRGCIGAALACTKPGAMPSYASRQEILTLT